MGQIPNVRSANELVQSMIKGLWATEDRNSSKECLSNLDPWVEGSCFYGSLTWLAKRV